MQSRNNTLRRLGLNFILFLIIISCNDNAVAPVEIKAADDQGGRASAASRVSNYVFDGSEGDPISLDTSSKWIDNYVAQNSGVTSNYFSKNVLRAILNIDGCMGIRFYYTNNEYGLPVLVATGTKSNGNDIQTPYNAIGLYSSTGLLESYPGNSFNGNQADSISLTLFKSSVAAYSEKNPSTSIAHFFGYQIIDQILSQSNCVGLRCYYAIDDKLGESKLILVGVSEQGQNIIPKEVSGGRIAEDTAILADFSFPCPTYCSGT